MNHYKLRISFVNPEITSTDEEFMQHIIIVHDSSYYYLVGQALIKREAGYYLMFSKRLPTHFAQRSLFKRLEDIMKAV